MTFIDSTTNIKFFWHLFTIFQRVFFFFISQNFEFNVDVYVVFCKIYQLTRHSRFSRILRKIRKINQLTNIEIFDKLEKSFQSNDLFLVQRTLFLEQIKSWYRFTYEKMRKLNKKSNESFDVNNTLCNQYTIENKFNLIEILHSIL